MNPDAQEYLDKILKKSPNDLNTEEMGFLRARRSYLKPAQVEEYKEVLEVKSVKEQPKENQTSEEETVKKPNAKSK